jgi:D-alanyl-D-alanine carboxypeptidase/D-alanyl-D-alanine-endopeptidase (penicillin-binding protein 4)
VTRRPRRRRLLATALLALAAVSVAAALRDGSTAAATAQPMPAARTALWSARRLPFVFADALARQRLTLALEDVANRYEACALVDDADERNGVLARVNGDRALTPASTTKLLTAAAALSALGPDHRFVTRALLADDGTLFLVGGGDPTLSTPEYETRLRASPRTRTDPVTPLAPLADAIAATGVTTVATIVADDSRHDTLRFLPDWKPSYRNDIGALGALTVDDGFDEGTRVDDPALLAAQQLGTLLAARGVAVGATAHGGRAPAEAREVGTVTSAPLADLVSGMLTSSDNLTAELLIREIGVSRAGDGTTVAGTEAVTAELRDLGVPTAGVDVRDGSGLSPQNRVPCDTIIGVLDLAFGNDDRFDAIDRGLAVAARTGTLVNRFHGDPLDGALRAKTGQIDGVAGLAGVVDDAEHLRFAFIVNGTFTAGGGQALQDQVAHDVAAYPDTADAGELVPHP